MYRLSLNRFVLDWALEDIIISPFIAIFLWMVCGDYTPCHSGKFCIARMHQQFRQRSYENKLYIQKSLKLQNTSVKFGPLLVTRTSDNPSRIYFLAEKRRVI